MTQNELLFQKREKAIKLLRQLQLYETDNYLPIVIEALENYIANIDIELKE